MEPSPLSAYGSQWEVNGAGGKGLGLWSKFTRSGSKQPLFDSLKYPPRCLRSLKKNEKKIREKCFRNPKHPARCLHLGGVLGPFRLLRTCARQNESLSVFSFFQLVRHIPADCLTDTPLCLLSFRSFSACVRSHPSPD